MASLTLIRGVSGSGKSTHAKRLMAGNPMCYWLETDMYFNSEDDGVYRFDPSKLTEAHQWCVDETKKYYDLGFDVIVSNTFTRKWEMEKYLTIDPNPQIIICQGRFQNTHGVPPEGVAKQLARFEY
jgi:adenylate kinase family enzyme